MNENYLRQAEMLRAEISEYLPAAGALNKEKLNINLQYLIDVPKGMNTDIPLSMAALFGIYQMSNFTSQFQYKIHLDESRIPCNMIGFLLAKSGQG